MSDEDHEHGHEHGQLKFLKTDADDETIASLRVLHPALADNLLYARRFPSLSDDEKKLLVETQLAIEKHDAWTPGYHAEGDMCATCGTPTRALFFDVLDAGALPYAAFIADVPVHAREACVAGFAARAPKRSPQALQNLRRELARDLERPTARLTQFFRADLFQHAPFELEDWANSVAEANQGKLDKATMKDIERLLRWVHERLFH